jgi:hypothetical protein
VVSLTAEPTPAWAAGSEPMIDSVAGATAKPMPRAMILLATTSGPYPECEVEVVIHIRQWAMVAGPVVTTILVPIRAATFAAG